MIQRLGCLFGRRRRRERRDGVPWPGLGLRKYLADYADDEVQAMDETDWGMIAPVPGEVPGTEPDIAAPAGSARDPQPSPPLPGVPQYHLLRPQLPLRHEADLLERQRRLPLLRS